MMIPELSSTRTAPRPVLKEWLPVRCCCQPQKIFGFMPVDSSLLSKSDQTIEIDNVAGDKIELKIKKFSASSYRQENVAYEMALYSDDRPVEFWFQFNGFIQAGVNDE